jgi:small conductance mechanosensitive channel
MNIDMLKEFNQGLISILPKIPVSLLMLLVGMIVIDLMVFLVKKSVRLFKIPDDLRGLVISVFKFSLWVVLLILIAQSLGLSNLALAISGSAVVVVFLLNTSFGPLLTSIVSGMFLISDPDFAVGMKVSLNDGKTEGVVVGIDMRKVRIKDAKGQVHVVPNSVVEGGEWIVVERKSRGKK